MLITWFLVSVTRLGDLLDFGQLFKAFGNIYFAQISHTLRQFLQRCQNLSFFLVKSVLGNFYRHLAIFFWSHCSWCIFFAKSDQLEDLIFRYMDNNSTLGKWTCGFTMYDYLPTFAIRSVSGLRVCWSEDVNWNLINFKTFRILKFE